MSEFQSVSFRAIDRPVSEKDIEYMRSQSSRAKVTPWSFDNEYHYGDFRGNALEMLRRGYDIHLHYANFGIRNLFIRLPNGLPDSAAKSYLVKDSLRFVQDKQGQGGALCIQPFHEPGDLEDLWEIGDILGRLLPLRAEILDGDLRPFYLAHLAVSCDGEHDPDETKEGPVPAGLGELTRAQRALAELYGLSEDLIAAAAQGAPPLAARDDLRNQQAEWIGSQPPSVKDAWLAQLLADPQSKVGGEIRTAFQKSWNLPAWATVRRDRTIAQLEAAAAEVQREATRKSAAKAAREKAKRLAGMAANPDPTLRQTESLVKKRTKDDYTQIGKLLAELREALAGTDRAGLAEQHAQKLRRENPTLRTLIAELRRAGFLTK
jgi:hypothetical protein